MTNAFGKIIMSLVPRIATSSTIKLCKNINKGTKQWTWVMHPPINKKSGLKVSSDPFQGIELYRNPDFVEEEVFFYDRSPDFCTFCKSTETTIPDFHLCRCGARLCEACTIWKKEKLWIWNCCARCKRKIDVEKIWYEIFIHHVEHVENPFIWTSYSVIIDVKKHTMKTRGFGRCQKQSQSIEYYGRFHDQRYLLQVYRMWDDGLDTLLCGKICWHLLFLLRK